MRRAFVTLTDGGRQVHYRHTGSGAPVVLLHTTPDSSLMLEPLATVLSAPGRTVFALDTPGYGESDALPVTDPSMEDYADALADTFSALGLEGPDVRGAGTGGTIAVAFALKYPRRVRSLRVDGPATCSPDEREWMHANFAPSLTPAWDGSHLVRAWTIRRDMHLFRPWFARTPAARLRSGLPGVDELQREFMDLLRAGEGWGQADQAAFRFDLAAALQNVQVPVLQGGARPEEKGDGLSAPPPPLVARKRSGFMCDYANVSFGQVHLRRAGPMDGVPLLMLHASPGSSRGLLPLAERLAAERPVVAMDTPGFGDSDPLAVSDPTIGDYADAVLEVIRALGAPRVDLYGSHTGALIALEGAVRGPDRVRRVAFDGLPAFSPDESADHLANYIPPFAPSWDGSHVVWAWNFVRNMVLFYPWYHQDAEHATGRAPSTAMVHERVVDLMKAGRGYALGYRAAYRFLTRAALARLTVPAMLCVSPDDVLAHHAEAVRQERPDITVKVLAAGDRVAASHDAIRTFFGSYG